MSSKSIINRYLPFSSTIDMIKNKNIISKSIIFDVKLIVSAVKKKRFLKKPNHFILKIIENPR